MQNTDRRIRKPSTLLLCASLATVAAIAFVTLYPVQWRPRLGDPNLERFYAYALLGSVFALTFRRRRLMVTFAIILIATALEAAQLLVPGRDAHVSDALFKAAGGVIGANLAYAIFPARRLLVMLVLKYSVVRRRKATPYGQSENTHP